MASGSWSLTSLCEQNGLGEKTQTKLQQEEINSQDDLTSLTEEDIKDLQLPIGQRRALVKAVDKLRKELAPEWTLSSWCEEHGLQEIQSRLEREKITSQHVVMSLTEDDIGKLNLTVGQTKALTSAITQFKLQDLKKTFADEWPMMEQLKTSTLSALYEQNIKSAQDVVKLTQQQIIALRIEDDQRLLLYSTVFQFSLKFDCLSAEEKRLQEFMKPHDVIEATVAQLRCEGKLDGNSLLALTTDRIRKMKLADGQNEALMAAVQILEADVAMAVKKLKKAFGEDWPMLQQLNKLTFSALYDQTIKSAQDVIKLTKQQIMALRIDDNQRQQLYTIVFRFSLKYDCFSDKEKGLHEFMKPHDVSEATVAQLRCEGKLNENSLLKLTKDRIRKMKLADGQSESLMAAVLDLMTEVAVRNAKIPFPDGWEEKYEFDKGTMQALKDKQVLCEFDLAQLTHEYITDMKLEKDQATRLYSIACRTALNLGVPRQELEMNPDLEDMVKKNKFHAFKRVLHESMQQQKPDMTENLRIQSKQFQDVCDNKGRSLLFYASSKSELEDILQAVSDETKKEFLNLEDKNGDTAILYHAKKARWDVIEALINHCEVIVGTQNRLGSSVLHQLARCCLKKTPMPALSDDQKEILKKILQKHDNLLTEVDINQQTSLHVAALAGNKAMVNYLCERKEELLIRPDKFNIIPLALASDEDMFKTITSYIEHLDQKKNSKTDTKRAREIFDVRMKIKKLKKFQSSQISHILDKSRNIGFFDETKEVKEIRKTVHCLIECLKIGISIIDPALKFLWEQAGSVSEGSKVNAPDEYDVTCNLILLATCVHPHLLNDGDPTHTYLKQHGDIPQALQDLFDEHDICMNGKLPCLRSDKLFMRLYSDCQKVISFTEFWDIFEKLIRVEVSDVTGYRTTISNLNIVWNGNEYPLQKISVDLVPVVKLPKSDKYEQHYTSLEPDCVVAKKVHRKKHNSYIFRLSYNEKEAKAMSIINPLAKDSYKMCKSLRHPAVCEVLPDAPPISDVITSYMIKNVVFALDKESAFDTNGKKDVLVLSREIYTKLRSHFEKEDLVMFFLPEQCILFDCWIKNDFVDMEMFKEKKKWSLDYCDKIIEKLQ